MNGLDITEHAGGVVQARLDEVRRRMLDAVSRTPLAESDIEFSGGLLGGGKMLRARLVLRMADACGVTANRAARSAAAVELVHAASLLHDDVIDGGHLRRAEPAFWVRHGVQSAILVGDLMLCEATRMLSGDGRLMQELVSLTSEVCRAEVEQELILRGRPADWDTAVRLARGKTGALFAFAAAAGCPDAPGSENLREALREAGYLAGTAYQLSDDVLDAVGDPDDAGKTLGRDRDRSKITAVSTGSMNADEMADAIRDMRRESEHLLNRFDSAADAWRDYWQCDLGPALDRNLAASSSAVSPVPA